MAPFNESKNTVVDINPKSLFRMVGLGVLALLIVILLFSSIARVESGHVGVLTLFGKVTPKVLSEGMHLINPFKKSHEMSIRTQEIKESATVCTYIRLTGSHKSLLYHRSLRT